MVAKLAKPDTSRLHRSPLQLVAFQIRYEPQLRAMDAQIALAFHEAVGGSMGAFEKLEPVNASSLQLSFSPGIASGAPVVAESTGLEGWRFSSPDGVWAIQLGRDSATLQTTAYETWPDSFRPRLGLLLSALSAHIGPRLEQRLGLRYVDRIHIPGLGAPSSWKGYVIPELLGLAIHKELGAAVTGAQQQLVLDLGDGVQCGFRHGFLRDPATLNDIQYFLDYDVFRQSGRAFDAKEIGDAADSFNIHALQLFQASISPELLAELR